MNRFRSIIYTAGPFILFAVFHYLTGAFLSDDPEFVRTVSLIITALALMLPLSQLIVKDGHFFPGTVALFFITWTTLLHSIPVDSYREVLSGSQFLTTVISRPMTGLYVFLFLMAAIPPLLGLQTFTYYFARRTTPEPFRKSRLFRRVNLILTGFWALLFLLSTGAQFIPLLPLRIGVPLVLQLGIGLPLTRILIPYLQNKLAYLERGAVKSYLTSAYDAVSGMPLVLHREKAAGLNIVMQFRITGEEEFNGFLTIRDKSCTYIDGIHENPDLTITSPSGTWLKIARGELPGSEAFLKRMYTAEGDLQLLMKISELFPGNSANEREAGEEPDTAVPDTRRSYASIPPGSVKKVLAVTGSPRSSGVSKTDMVTEAFLRGCSEAGASVEVIKLREKEINHCTGCYTCWTKTPGKCVFNDDAAPILEKEFKADLVVFGFPLYHYGINSLMKKYIERNLPILQPYLIEGGNGRTKHPLREGFKKPRYAVIISVCGFPEVIHFSAASANFHKMAQSPGDGLTIVAELYRPASESLTVPFFREETERVLRLYREAGRSAVEKGNIDREIIEGIARVEIDKEKFKNEANMVWDLCIKEEKTLSQIQNEFMASGKGESLAQ